MHVVAIAALYWPRTRHDKSFDIIVIQSLPHGGMLKVKSHTCTKGPSPNYYLTP